MDFATGEVEQAMAEQAEIERQACVPLEVSMRPTVRIARQLFAHAAKHLDQVHARIVSGIGERVGRFLFFMDNLLDLGPDLCRRRYNALAAAYGLTDAESLCKFDVNCSGTINTIDVGLTEAAYGVCTAASGDPCWMD